VSEPAGGLLLTTPSYYYGPITGGDKGPFSVTENGGHVRRGYTQTVLAEFCDQANLPVEEISFCAGFLSQKTTFVYRKLSGVLPPLLAWGCVIPLRVLSPVFDPFVARIAGLPYYIVGMEAYKPRHNGHRRS